MCVCDRIDRRDVCVLPRTSPLDSPLVVVHTSRDAHLARPPSSRTSRTSRRSSTAPRGSGLSRVPSPAEKNGSGKRCETWGWGRCPNSQAWRMPTATAHTPPTGAPPPRAHTRHRGVIELQGYYNKRTISVYTGEGERRVIAVAAPRVGSCLLTAFLNRRSSAALSISAPPRNPALDWPK